MCKKPAHFAFQREVLVSSYKPIENETCKKGTNTAYRKQY